MRRKFLLISLLIIGVVTALYVLTLEYSANNIKNTSLSNLYFNDLIINTELEKYKLNNYTPNSKFESKKNTLYFNETTILTSDNNKIKKVIYYVNEFNNTFENKIHFASVNDVIAHYGDNYNIKTFDREQGLKKISYIDNDNKILGEFIFSSYDSKLVWIIVSSY